MQCWGEGKQYLVHPSLLITSNLATFTAGKPWTWPCLFLPWYWDEGLKVNVFIQLHLWDRAVFYHSFIYSFSVLCPYNWGRIFIHWWLRTLIHSCSLPIQLIKIVHSLLSAFVHFGKEHLAFSICIHTVA